MLAWPVQVSLQLPSLLGLRAPHLVLPHHCLLLDPTYRVSGLAGILPSLLSLPSKVLLLLFCYLTALLTTQVTLNLACMGLLIQMLPRL